MSYGWTDGVGSSRVGRQATVQLARTRRKAEDVGGLLEMLSWDETTYDKWLSRYVIKGLGAIGDPQAVEGLSAQLRHPDHHVRMYAARALGALRSSWAVDPLIDALQDSDAVVRESAAFGLGDIGDPRATIPLGTVLSADPTGSVRASAAQALGQIGEPSSEARLVSALDDDFILVRQEAAFALAEIGGGAERVEAEGRAAP